MLASAILRGKCIRNACQEGRRSAEPWSLDAPTPPPAGCAPPEHPHFIAHTNCPVLLPEENSLENIDRGNNEIGEHETQGKCMQRNEPGCAMCTAVSMGCFLHRCHRRSGAAAVAFASSRKGLAIKPGAASLPHAEQHNASPQRSKVAARLRQKYLF